MDVDDIHPAHREKLADIYDTAASYIEEHGWTQGEEKNAAGQVCLVGGFRWGTRLSNTWATSEWAMGMLQSLLGLASPNYDFGLCPLVAWNDNPARTQDEVVNVLRGYANKLR